MLPRIMLVHRFNTVYSTGLFFQCATLGYHLGQHEAVSNWLHGFADFVLV